MADIPTTIPFLQSAYSPRPQYPDTGGQSFMRAREHAQEMQLKKTELAQNEATHAIQRRVAEQSLKKGALDLELAIRNRDDVIASKEDFLGMKTLADEFGENLNTPDGLSAVTDYFMRRPKLLKNPDALELWKMVSTATDARSRSQAALRERAGASTDTSAIRNAAYLSTLRKDAEYLRSKGDTAGYQSKQSEIAAMEEQIQKGQTFRAYGPGGEVTAELISGGGGGATTAMKTQAQGKLARYENSTALITDLQANLRPEDVGARGLLGEMAVDRGLAQFFPEMANKDRIENRATLQITREGLMREISDDPRFNQSDRDEIGKALPSSGVFESYPNAIERLNKVRTILADRSRTYAQRTGTPVPDFAKKDEEIVSEYESQKAAIQKASDEHRITPAQAESELKDAYTRAASARRKFHGIMEP